MTATSNSVELDSEINRGLERASRETGHSVAELAREAIEEWLEDREDAREALEILARNETARSSDEVRKRLGLER
jgi:predicted DNA-binding protein